LFQRKLKAKQEKKVIEFGIHLHYLICHIATVKIKRKEKKSEPVRYISICLFLNGKIVS